MGNPLFLEETTAIVELERILNSEDISTVFQPIVSLTDGEIIGYEALSRGPKGSVLEYPNKLFAIADEEDKSWDLELLCRKKAISGASKMNKNNLLFINVSPHIFNDIQFRKGFTRNFLSLHNIDPKNIIFEITEKSAVEDFKQFNEAIEHYTEQGYKIAIDDIGAGYSGLRMLTEVKPHYVKIDMDLIRSIDTDNFKQALIESFVKLAKLTNMRLIAEGIETREELFTLIDLGVSAGQGYVLSKPNRHFIDIPSELKNDILNYNYLKTASNNHHYIGQLPIYTSTFSLNTKCEKVHKYLENTDIPGACIIENKKPVGLIMKHIIDSRLATTYGVSVFYKRPISLIMDNNPIIVDYYTDVTKVSKLAMSRSNNKVYDCIIITKDNNFYGLITIKSLLEFITTIEYNYAKGLNPLTGLPGNKIIQQTFSRVINSSKSCCVLYLDLDNFKIFNDTYGFENGDKIIHLVSKIVQNEVTDYLSSNGFVGHIGGDDFICIIDESLDTCRALCAKIISCFDSKVINYFTAEDRENGYIGGNDRNGLLCKYPLTSLSIAGLYGNFQMFNSIEEVGVYMASIKKKAKTIKGSSYIIDELP